VLRDDGTLWVVIGDCYAGSRMGGCKPKDLIGIPWMLAFALRDDGWHLRQDIIWHKTNPMPESVKDRCTKSHEYVFLLSKSRCYFFDQSKIKEQASYRGGNKSSSKRTADPSAMTQRVHYSDRFRASRDTRNKHDVWTVSTAAYRGAHFAVFPEKLVEPCILAGCPEGGIVLDPFLGTGTTAVVAFNHSRHFVGIDLNAEYIEVAEKRIAQLRMDGKN
jgi:DNA modification methylase